MSEFTTMPCGHSSQYVYPPDGDEGTTRNCLVCLLEARVPSENAKDLHTTDLSGTDPWLQEHITDGYSWYPRYCPDCGAPMVIVRPGDCRCGADCQMDKSE
jgi:hypothetical protein